MKNFFTKNETLRKIDDQCKDFYELTCNSTWLLYSWLPKKFLKAYTKDKQDEKPKD